jgi:uncharacterized protein YkwD
MGLRIAIGLAVAATAVFAAAYGVVLPRLDGASAHGPKGCGGAELGSEARIERTRTTILCLLNGERARHDLPRLKQNAILEASSQRHSEDMVRRHFFAHETPDGVSPGERMRAAGYDAPFWVGKRRAAIYTTDFGGPLEPEADRARSALDGTLVALAAPAGGR